MTINSIGMSNFELFIRIISAVALFFIGVWVGYIKGRQKKDEQGNGGV